MIDMSDVLHDTELGAVALQRVRIDQDVNGNGRAVETETTSDFTGVVTQDAGAISRRVPDGQYTSGSIMVTTDYSLRMLGQDVDADRVIWNGGRYIVGAIAAYDVHGVYEAVCTPEGPGR